LQAQEDDEDESSPDEALFVDLHKEKHMDGLILRRIMALAEADERIEDVLAFVKCVLDRFRDLFMQNTFYKKVGSLKRSLELFLHLSIISSCLKMGQADWLTCSS
jgi:hypothetical protein